jgi:hypothetical protein
LRVQRAREHRGLVPEDGGGAVARCTSQSTTAARAIALAQQHRRRDRDVVERAGAFAPDREGVMRPPARLAEIVSPRHI